MFVKMLRTEKGSPTGLNLKWFKKGETYLVDEFDNMTELLAKVFVDIEAAEYVKEEEPVIEEPVKEKEDAGPAPENFDAGPAPENFGEPKPKPFVERKAQKKKSKKK